MKLIRTVDAIGHVLCHDMTQIIKDVKKDAAFRKGHVVTADDVPVLLSMGKENLYVWEVKPGILHENDAAEMLFGMCRGESVYPSEVKEGKIDIFANIDGLFRVDTARLEKINSLGEIIISTRHGNFPVKKGDKLAGTRIVPLVIEESKIQIAKEISGDAPLVSVVPFARKKAAIVTTGSEVYHGRIKDTFTPVILEKLSEYNVEVIAHETIDDNAGSITSIISGFASQGADLILCTGGMSVDPDDTTPLAIRNTGAEIVSYGAPVLPGAMFLLAYLNGSIPILGLPGCVMYARRTIFDLVLPRIMADIKVTSSDLSRLGHGGLCLNCDVCAYPNCGFGK